MSSNNLRVSSLVKHKLYDEYLLLGIVTNIEHNLIYVSWFFVSSIAHNVTYGYGDLGDWITYLEIVNR